MEYSAIHCDVLLTIDPRENEEALHPKMTEERKRNLEAFKRRTAMLKDYFVED